jgi:superfamily II DNA helicase RecQ
MDILQLKRKGPQATLCFQAPLERKLLLLNAHCIIANSDEIGPNLRYHVQYKPKTMVDQITTMAEWIKREHPGQRGIIYCLSKKESQTVAEGLAQQHQLATGVYHADLTDVSNNNNSTF